MNHEEIDIEMRIWEYLDGYCNPQQHTVIAGLIASDLTWKRKYDEITALQATLTAGLEQEQPGMRFSKNVMDAVEQESIAPAVRSYLNKWVIRGIASLFIVFIAAAVWLWASSFSLLPSEAGYFRFYRSISIPTGSILPVVVSLNIIAVLLLLDAFMKRKRRLGQYG